jgi:exodeoxyribonuclease VII large subunit
MLARTGSDAGQMKLSLGQERQVFRVSELNAAVQNLFEAEFRSVWVAGEISSCRMAPSGHYYFSLKDEQSQLKCALFKGAARFAKFKPQDGLAVIARGNLEVYEARGEYQLIVELLEPQGAGALQVAFEQLKKKLAAEGLFEEPRKRPLPKLPRRIGVVTSPAGAAIRDILHVLERRFQGLHVQLFPSLVQGEGSVDQICEGIRYFGTGSWADVVILTRGGGSLEDLWSFNDENVARAIAASKVPVISAVGHETDFTISDFVADYRAPTPSAAAEIVICTRESLVEQIDACRAKAIQAIRYRLILSSRDLHQRGTDRALALVHRTITRRAQRADEWESRLRQLQRRLLETKTRQFKDWNRRLQGTDLRLRFARNRHRRELMHEQLVKHVRASLWNAQRKHEFLQAHLTQLSPLAVLERGYAIVANAQGHVVRSSAEISTGEQIKVRLHRGELDAAVSATHREN